ncbi:coiled-coil domain-containing protein 97 [Phalaenopsis equestris]|uniref:coiled-coil domain-containing protein 97 n=1 Tax=Phalaenopsis equestris TaxID=78828 RepID=UPI0009E2FF52|nr:coiled-coil domain-containing protein 97 [Phalaenopsis equestris]
MERSAMEGIAGRLAAIDGLYFPGGIRSQQPDASQRKAALLDLISRDAPIFLERYGTVLNYNELSAFDVLRSEYEVGWYVDRLRRSLVPTEADSRAKSATVRNRRRAYMERLIRGGEYFSEDSMREREPYLHHEYVGRFQDPVVRVLSRPGEKWSETLMRRCEEAMLVKKIRDEQQRLGVARKDWVGGADAGEEASEDDDASEEERNEMELPSSSSKAREDDTNANGEELAELPNNALSTEEMQEQMDQFTYIMHQKFLAGEDTEHLDYSAIDNDEGLDDHWIKEANHDAEEKYFDED